MRQFFKGFRLGMLLQLAVGPVFLYIFQQASVNGFFSAFAGVAGVVLADGLYIFAALLGIAAVIGKVKIKRGLSIFGAAVLAIFGADMILGVFGIGFIPSAATGALPAGSFVYALLLTLSSPLTILFWAGVFSARMAKETLSRKQMYVFGLGALSSTLIFLSAAAAAGNFIGILLPPLAITILRAGVGSALIFFGVRMLINEFSRNGSAVPEKTDSFEG